MKMKKIIAFITTIIMVIHNILINNVCSIFYNSNVLAENNTSKEIMLELLLDVESEWSWNNSSKECYLFQDLDFDSICELIVCPSLRLEHLCYVYKYINNKWENVGRYDASAYQLTDNQSGLVLYFNDKSNQFKYIVKKSYENARFGNTYYSSDSIYEVSLNQNSILNNSILSETSWYSNSDKSDITYSYVYNGVEVSKDEYDSQYELYCDDLENNYSQVYYNTDAITIDEWLSYTTDEEKLNRLLKSYNAFSVEDNIYNNFIYKIENNQVTITKYINKAVEMVEIPESIKGYPVTKLDDGVFTLCDNIQEVIIPKSVVSIGDATFPVGVLLNRNTPLIIKGYPGSEAELFVNKFADGDLKDCYEFVSLIGQIFASVSCKDSIAMNSINTIEVKIFIGNIGIYDLNDIFVNIYSNIDNLTYTLQPLDGWSLTDNVINGSLQHYHGDTITFTITSDSNFTSPIKLDFEIGSNSYGTETYTTSKTILMDLLQDNTLDSKDIFNFKNSYDDFGIKELWGIKRPNKYNISNDALEKLLDGTDNIVQEYIKKQANKPWTGSCYGMSEIVSLIKGGYLNLESLNLDNIDELDFPKNSIEVENIINFYNLSQYLPYIYEDSRCFEFKQEINLKEIVQETKKVQDGGLPVLICYSYTNSNNENGAHAVIGYKCECVDSNGKLVDETSENFEKYKIYIYDCAKKKSNNFKPIYMYIGKYYNYWYYDGLSDLRIDDDGNECKNIELVTSSLSELNMVDYITGAKSSLWKSSYNSNFIKYHTSSGVYIDTENSSSQLSTLGLGIGDLKTYTIPDFCTVLDIDGNEIPCNSYTTYFDDDFQDEDIIIMLDETGEADFSMIYSNCMTSASATSMEGVTMKSDGMINLVTDNSNYEVSLTFNEGYYTLPWHTVSIAGAEANEVSMEKSENGIIVNSDNIDDMTISVSNSKEEKKLEVSTDKENILITNDYNNDIEICADIDNDGKYETLTDLSKAEIEVSNLLYTGQEQFIKPIITYNGNILIEDKDYIIQGDNFATDIGKYEVIIKGIGLYMGTIRKNYTIYCSHNFDADGKCNICNIFENSIGDMNGDNIINYIDLLLLKKNIIMSKNTYFSVEDLNNDSNINIIDVIILKNKILQQNPTDIISSGSCGENLTYILTKNGNFTLEGYGNMTFDNGIAPWNDYIDNIKNIDINIEVTTETLNSSIDEVVEYTDIAKLSICDNAFFGCKSLEKVTFSYVPWYIVSNISIGHQAFNECINLQEITIIGDFDYEYDSFYKDTIITYNHLDGSFNAIQGDFKFIITTGTMNSDHATLTEYIGNDNEITIPNDVCGYPLTKIDSNAFSNCTNLETVIITSKETTWTNDTFSNDIDIVYNYTDIN